MVRTDRKVETDFVLILYRGINALVFPSLKETRMSIFPSQKEVSAGSCLAPKS